MEQELNTKIVLTSTLKKEGIDTLKTQIANYNQLENSSCLDFRDIDPDYFASLHKTFPNQSIYKLW
jgi:ferrous iron transport protein B